MYPTTITLFAIGIDIPTAIKRASSPPGIIQVITQNWLFGVKIVVYVLSVCQARCAMNWSLRGEAIGRGSFVLQKRE